MISFASPSTHWKCSFELQWPRETIGIKCHISLSTFCHINYHPIQTHMLPIQLCQTLNLEEANPWWYCKLWLSINFTFVSSVVYFPNIPKLHYVEDVHGIVGLGCLFEWSTPFFGALIYIPHNQHVCVC